jgi:hypothetical protein
MSLPPWHLIRGESSFTALGYSPTSIGAIMISCVVDSRARGISIYTDPGRLSGSTVLVVIRNDQGDIADAEMTVNDHRGASILFGYDGRSYDNPGAQRLADAIGRAKKGFTVSVRGATFAFEAENMRPIMRSQTELCGTPATR